MSIKKLSDRIRELSLALAQARSDGDTELVEQLEDDLYELEDQLESELENEYESHDRDFT